MGEVQSIMTDIYNLTNVSSSANFLEMTQHANTLSGGWFGNLALISFCLIMFISTRSSSIATKTTTALFITTIVGMLLRVTGLVGDYILFVFVALTAGSFVMLYRSKSNP